MARLTTLGELTASIAHEDQPLGAMVNSANACVRWLAAQNLERAQSAACGSWPTASAPAPSSPGSRPRQERPPRKDWLDINDTIRDVLALARSEVQRHGVMADASPSLCRWCGPTASSYSKSCSI